LTDSSDDEEHGYIQPKPYTAMFTLVTVDPTRAKAAVLAEGDISPSVMMDFENVVLEFLSPSLSLQKNK
jgi:hypothetical protein